LVKDVKSGRTNVGMAHSVHGNLLLIITGHNEIVRG
jgi:hypothetical protein